MAISAGILVHRWFAGRPEVLLAHPGGPLWGRRDLGSWTVPKGLVEAGEEPLAAAIREFSEETGLSLGGPFRPLSPVRQKGGKLVLCWAIEADVDISKFAPGEFEMEWPPRSGRVARFPELDQLRYFAVDQALVRILPSQAPLIREALQMPASPSL
jgi:predicted NUDIX family NTP pyrophosphohydrolase